MLLLRLDPCSTDHLPSAHLVAESTVFAGIRNPLQQSLYETWAMLFCYWLIRWQLFALIDAGKQRLSKLSQSLYFTCLHLTTDLYRYILNCWIHNEPKMNDSTKHFCVLLEVKYTWIFWIMCNIQSFSKPRAICSVVRIVPRTSPSPSRNVAVCAGGSTSNPFNKHHAQECIYISFLPASAAAARPACNWIAHCFCISLSFSINSWNEGRHWGSLRQIEKPIS